MQCDGELESEDENEATRPKLNPDQVKLAKKQLKQKNLLEQHQQSQSEKPPKQKKSKLKAVHNETKLLEALNPKPDEDNDQEDNIETTKGKAKGQGKTKSVENIPPAGTAL